MTHNPQHGNDARKRVREAAQQGDPMAMSVVAKDAELGREATQWIYEDFGDDPETMDWLMHHMLKDD